MVGLLNKSLRVKFTDGFCSRPAKSKFIGFDSFLTL